MKIVSLIPARGSSKGIPKKNLAQLRGLPLIYYVIKASLGSIVNETWVSTDDLDIKFSAQLWGARVLDRPKELATDTSPTEDAIKHFLGNVECNAVVLIQPTSPMLSPDDINRGVRVFEQDRLDSLFSATRPLDMLFWQVVGQLPPVPLNYNPQHRGVRQDRKQPIIIETGGFYIFSRESFLKYNNRLGGKIGYVEVPFWRSFEVDDLEDLNNIEKLLGI